MFCCNSLKLIANYYRFEPLSEESKCSLCGAFFFHEEATRASGKRRIFRRCCDNGKMAFPFIQPPDEHLHNLYTGNSSEAKLFQKSIRKFNTALAFASVVSKLAEFTTKGPPVVIVQGNIQHRIGSLQKPPDKVAAYMQCYFYEEGGKDNAYFKCTNQEVLIKYIECFPIIMYHLTWVFYQQRKLFCKICECG